ncbi:unnamed protein product [Pedinophyceae sp. YPF-701]|nr:unnamed protein product [Pedinophyceae sp. YPF-701]
MGHSRGVEALPSNESMPSVRHAPGAQSDSQPHTPRGMPKDPLPLANISPRTSRERVRPSITPAAKPGPPPKIGVVAAALRGVRGVSDATPRSVVSGHDSRHPRIAKHRSMGQQHGATPGWIHSQLSALRIEPRWQQGGAQQAAPRRTGSGAALLARAARRNATGSHAEGDGGGGGGASPMKHLRRIPVAASGLIRKATSRETSTSSARGLTASRDGSGGAVLVERGPSVASDAELATASSAPPNQAPLEPARPPPLRRASGRPMRGSADGARSGGGGTDTEAGGSGALSGADLEIDLSEVELGERIGVGASAEVNVGRWNGTLVAVKQLMGSLADPSLAPKFRREVEILMRLRHPNLVLFMGYCTKPRMAIVTEYMRRGTLHAQIERTRGQPLHPRLQLAVAFAVAKAMAYLHTRPSPVLHLDLKSPNILVDERWRVKVADFGLSKVMGPHGGIGSIGSGVGTPQWTAPEILSWGDFDGKADVYSYGVVLWELLTGKIPWEGYNAMQLIAAVGVEGRTLELPDGPHADAFLAQLCRDCLKVDPKDRPSFQCIVERLQQHYSGPPQEAVVAAGPGKHRQTLSLGGDDLSDVFVADPAERDAVTMGEPSPDQRASIPEAARASWARGGPRTPASPQGSDRSYASRTESDGTDMSEGGPGEAAGRGRTRGFAMPARTASGKANWPDSSRTLHVGAPSQRGAIGENVPSAVYNPTSIPEHAAIGRDGQVVVSPPSSRGEEEEAGAGAGAGRPGGSPPSALQARRSLRVATRIYTQWNADGTTPTGMRSATAAGAGGAGPSSRGVWHTSSSGADSAHAAPRTASGPTAPSPRGDQAPAGGGGTWAGIQRASVEYSGSPRAQESPRQGLRRAKTQIMGAAGPDSSRGYRPAPPTSQAPSAAATPSVSGRGRHLERSATTSLLTDVRTRAAEGDADSPPAPEPAESPAFRVLASRAAAALQAPPAAAAARPPAPPLSRAPSSMVSHRRSGGSNAMDLSDASLHRILPDLSNMSLEPTAPAAAGVAAVGAAAQPHHEGSTMSVDSAHGGGAPHVQGVVGVGLGGGASPPPPLGALLSRNPMAAKLAGHLRRSAGGSGSSGSRWGAGGRSKASAGSEMELGSDVARQR